MSAVAVTKSNDQDAQRIITPEFRVSYPHLIKANAFGGGKPKFSVTMLYPKKGDLTVLKNAIRAAKIEKFGSKENWPADIASPVQDGDAPSKPGKEERTGYAGHWVIKATANEDSRPTVVDENAQTVMDAKVIYPGCYARAAIFARVWEFPVGSGRFGVQLILNGVQKTRDGETFSTRKPVEFDPIAASADDDDDVRFSEDDIAF